MATRIVLRNRVAMIGRGPDQHARMSESARAAGALPMNRARDTVINTQAIPPDSPESPFRDGHAWRCPDDQLTYRVVQSIDISAGWGTAAFWMTRYGVTFLFVREWVERGWLDAAIEQGTPTKRYRCRDERRIYEALWVLHDTKNSLKPGVKSSMRAALSRLKPLFEAP